MWVSYQRLADPAIPRHLLQSDPELRRPMVPRIRQTQHHPVVPKTVVTLYREEDDEEGNGHRSPQSTTSPTSSTPITLWSWFRRLLKHSVSPQNSTRQSKEQQQQQPQAEQPSTPSPCSWISQLLHDPEGNGLTLVLMFLDVLVNTLMLVLNYTTLVIDFFDNIDWSTVQTRIDLSLASEESSEHYYVQRLNSRRSTLAKLNMLLYMLVYIAQAVGFYGVVRQRETLLIAYVTQLAIQIIVLVFTIILRPFWASVCLLRIVLFALVLKLCLKISDRNVHLVWDFDCSSHREGAEGPSGDGEGDSARGGGTPDSNNPNVTTFRPLSVAAREEKLARASSQSHCNLQVLDAPRQAHGSFKHRRRPSSVSVGLSSKSSFSSASTLCFDAEPDAEQRQQRQQQQQQEQLRMSTPILAAASSSAEHDASSGALFARPQTATALVGNERIHRQASPNELPVSKQNKQTASESESKSKSNHGSISSLDSNSAVMEVMANINHVLTVPSSLPTAFTTFEAQPIDSVELN